jgi:hypothetical protein
MTSRLAALALSAAFLLASVGGAGATVLYEPTPISSSARTSHYGDVSGSGFRTFDNFTLGAGASVEKVSWAGFWIDFGNPQPAAAPAPDVSSWDIAFYDDNAGAPGAQLLLETFAPADVNATSLGAGTFTTVPTYNVSFYDYSVELASPLALAAGMQYWVSILSHADTSAPSFVLRGATGGDDASYQQTLGAFMGVASAGPVARDRAVTLEGTLAVPEPQSLVLAATSLLLLVILCPAARRRLCA